MRLTSATPIAVLAVGLSIASAHADDKPKWTMTTEKNAVTLAYGDDSEETDLALICKPHSNSVSIFVGETDKSLKPKMQVTVTFTAGAARLRSPARPRRTSWRVCRASKANSRRPIRYSTRCQVHLRSRSRWRKPPGTFR